MNIGCMSAGRSINVLAYVYDIILLAPSSWSALHSLVDTIEFAAGAVAVTYCTIVLAML
jgi:hypothetical protein